MSASQVTYLDPSALVKLVVAEPETPALRSYLRRRVLRASCALARVEVVRALRPQGPSAVARSLRLLERVNLIALDDILLETAAGLDAVSLRSLDAIHLAAAQTLGEDLEGIVTYDARMAEAARELRMSVVAPG
jgi:predicted nucleic acid-binding protein